MKSIFANVTSSVCSTLKLSQLSDAELPLFPLGSVLFPGGTMALKIFEQRYLEMAKSALKAGTPFGISLIRQGNEVGAPAVPEGVGTIALITHWDMQNLGILQLKIRGEQRFKLLSLSTSRSGLIMGTVTMLPRDNHADCPELADCAAFLRKILTRVGLTETLEQQCFDDAEWVGYRVTELLPLGNAVKQKMLELTDARIRLEILHRFLVDQRLLG